MNALLNEHSISVKGLDNAFELARVLIKNDYQVMIQLDDFDIYVVAYAHNDLRLGSKRFALISEAEEYELIGRHFDEEHPEPQDYDDTHDYDCYWDHDDDEESEDIDDTKRF